MDDYFVTTGGESAPEPPDGLSSRALPDLPQLLHSPFVEPRSVRVLRRTGLVLLGLGVLALAALPILAVQAVFTFFESLPF